MTKTEQVMRSVNQIIEWRGKPNTIRVDIPTITGVWNSLLCQLPSRVEIGVT